MPRDCVLALLAFETPTRSPTIIRRPTIGQIEKTQNRHFANPKNRTSNLEIPRFSARPE
jgi:hypothetical protein